MSPSEINKKYPILDKRWKFNEDTGCYFTAAEYWSLDNEKVKDPWKRWFPIDKFKPDKETFYIEFKSTIEGNVLIFHFYYKNVTSDEMLDKNYILPSNLWNTSNTSPLTYYTP